MNRRIEKIRARIPSKYRLPRHATLRVNTSRRNDSTFHLGRLPLFQQTIKQTRPSPPILAQTLIPDDSHFDFAPSTSTSRSNEIYPRSKDKTLFFPIVLTTRSSPRNFPLFRSTTNNHHRQVYFRCRGRSRLFPSRFVSKSGVTRAMNERASV